MQAQKTQNQTKLQKVLETQQDLEGFLKDYNAWCKANPTIASKANRQLAKDRAHDFMKRFSDLLDNHYTIMKANEEGRFKEDVVTYKRSNE